MIKGGGLGNHSKAVGWTSAQKKGQRGATPYAAIYAKGARDGRAVQALEAYSKGVTIRAVNGEWLAFATSAIPARVGRKKITPKLYNNTGLPTSHRKLINNGRASCRERGFRRVLFRALEGGGVDLGAEEGPARRHALCRDLCEGRTRRPGSAGARGVQQGRDDPRGQRRVAGVRNQCNSCTGWPEKNHAEALQQQRPRDIDRQAHLPQGQTEPRPARGAQGVAVAEDGPREGARTAGHAHPHRSREGHRRLRAHPPDAPGEALGQGCPCPARERPRSRLYETVARPELPLMVGGRWPATP